MEGSTTTIAQTLSTALQSTADQAIEGIGVVLPVALSIMGALLVITIGLYAVFNTMTLHKHIIKNLFTFFIV